MKSPCLNCTKRSAPQCRLACKELHNYDLFRIEKSRHYSDNDTFTRGSFVRQMQAQRYLLKFGGTHHG